MKQISIEPKEYVLRIREVDREIFLALKDGTKSVETRAAKPRYLNVQKGDTLVFTCDSEKIEKIVKKTEYFNSIAAMAKEISYKKIAPALSSSAEMQKLIYSFPGNEEKVKEFGIVAWYL